MDEIGIILRDAREERGLSYADVEEKLKIQARFLEAMEEGRFDQLPTAVQAKGFLKNYSRHLGLEAQPLLESFDAMQRGYGGRRTKVTASADGSIRDGAALPPREDNPFFNPVNVELNPAQTMRNGESILRIIIILALLVAILLVGSRFVVGNNRELNFTDVFNTVILGETPPTADEIDAEELVESAEETPADSLQSQLVETGRGVVLDEDVPTPVPELLLPQNLEIINLKLETTERVYLVLTVDGELQVRDNVQQGETIEITAQSSIEIDTGNAFALYMTINGQPVGRLGERNEVKNIVLETVSQ